MVPLLLLALTIGTGSQGGVHMCVHIQFACCYFFRHRSSMGEYPSGDGDTHDDKRPPGKSSRDLSEGTSVSGSKCLWPEVTMQSSTVMH